MRAAAVRFDCFQEVESPDPEVGKETVHGLLFQLEGLKKPFQLSDLRWIHGDGAEVYQSQPSAQGTQAFIGGKKRRAAGAVHPRYSAQVDHQPDFAAGDRLFDYTLKRQVRISKREGAFQAKDLDLSLLSMSDLK
ncbi:MAG TPA: hypothetical protein VKT81_11375 [Bryobacteraceae bacterium]|nr:hypothetical protein [Bryobacteraceae bacterium]